MSRLRLQRTRIYLGCEGQSEQSYAKRLNEIADAAGLHLHIDNDLLQPGGGSPLAIVESAVRRIALKVRNRGDFVHRAVLLDRDRLMENSEWEPRIVRLAGQHELRLIWQDSCHEAFLLRHLDGTATMRPQNTALACKALQIAWPGFYKNMPAALLAPRIDLQAVRRACAVEPGLAGFLGRIGLVRR